MASPARTSARVWSRAARGGLAVALVCAMLASPAGASEGARDRSPVVSALSSTAPMEALITEADADIPGVTLPASPLTNSLDDTAGIDDLDDVFRVPLTFNQKLTASMVGDVGKDFDLYLFRPNTPSVQTSNLDRYIATASCTEATSTESFWYPASSAGTYYLDVYYPMPNGGTTGGHGSYTLTWEITQLKTPAATLASPPAVVGYNASVKLSGTVLLDGAPMASARVLIQRRPAGSTSWTGINYNTTVKPAVPKTVTDGSGRFSYTATGLTDKSEFRALVWPSQTAGWGPSNAVSVTPRLYLSRPSVSTRVYRNRSFSVRGYLKPRHTSGAKTVTITAYRTDSGMWRRARNYNYSSYTKYVATLNLPYKGTWRLVATTPADSKHAATTSSATYITVR